MGDTQESFFNPVFRRGVICSPPASMKLNHAQSMMIGSYFEGKEFGQNSDAVLANYESSLKEFCTAHDFTDVSLNRSTKDLENRIRLSYQLTPIVRFPRYVMHISGVKYIVSESITVCIGSSDSKLWISLYLPDGEEKLTMQQVRRHYETFLGYSEAREIALREYYAGVIRMFIKEKEKDFAGMKLPDFTINPKLKVIVASIEAGFPANGLIFSETSDFGKKELLNHIEANEDLNVLFNPFFKWSGEASGVEKTEKFQFMLQNSTPMDGSLPLVQDGCLSLAQLSLILSIRKGGDSPTEYYFTIGNKDNRITDRKISNATISSRSIMIGVGASY